MLTPAWYLTDGDYFADLPHAPRQDFASFVLGEVTGLLGDEAGFSPAQTITATQLALTAAVHLNDTVTHAARLHDVTEVVRLLGGLNLLHAYLTQAIRQLATHADARTFAGFADAPAAVMAVITESLSVAGANGELVAGHLKEAHLALQQVTAA